MISTEARRDGSPLGIGVVGLGRISAAHIEGYQ